MILILVHFGHQIYNSFITVYEFFNTPFRETLLLNGIVIPEFTEPIFQWLEVFFAAEPIYWFLPFLPYVLIFLFYKFIVK